MPNQIDPRIVQMLRKKTNKPDPILDGLTGLVDKFSNFGKPEAIPMSSQFASVDERDAYAKIPTPELPAQPITPEETVAFAEQFEAPKPQPTQSQMSQEQLGGLFSTPVPPQQLQKIVSDEPMQQPAPAPKPARQPAVQPEPSVEEMVNYEPAGYNDSDADLKAAQEAAASNRTMNALGKSGDMLVSALTGAKQHGEFYNQLDKNSLQNVQDLQDRRKAQDQSLEFQTKADSRNPNSPDNQAFRAFLKSQPEFAFLTKSPNFDKLTLANPALTKIVDMYQKAQDRRSALEVARQNAINKRELDLEKLGIQGQRLGLSERRFQDKLTQQDELTPKQLEEIKNFNTSLDRIEQISQLKKDFSTGPLDSRVASFRKAFGMDDAKRSAFKSKVGRLLSDYMKGISGTAISEPEAKRLASNFLSDNLSDETFLTTLEDLYKEIGRNKQVALETYKQGGRNVEALRGSPMQQQPKQRAKPAPGSIVSVKGVKYRVGANGEDLEPLTK